MIKVYIFTFFSLMAILNLTTPIKKGRSTQKFDHKENLHKTIDSDHNNVKKFSNHVSMSKKEAEKVGDYDWLKYDSEVEETWAVALGGVGDVLGMIGGALSIIPFPVTQGLGAICGAIGGLFGIGAGVAKDLAIRKQQIQTDLFNAAMQQIKEERRKILEKIEIVLQQNQQMLDYVNETLVILIGKFSNLEIAIKNATVYLTNLLQNAAEQTKSVLVFMEYREKRDEFDIIENRMWRFIRLNGSMLALEDLIYDCNALRPQLILAWIHHRVMTGEILPSLLPSILSYVNYNFLAFEDWKKIILGDSAKAIIYQEICHQVATPRVPDFVRIHDRRWGEEKLFEIMQRMYFFEEKALHKALYDETQGIKARLQMFVSGQKECTPKREIQKIDIANKVLVFLQKEYNFGAWAVIIKEEKDYKYETYADNSAQTAFRDPTKVNCQYNFVIENVCQKSDQNLTAVIHVVRFNGEWKLVDESIRGEIKKELKDQARSAQHWFESKTKDFSVIYMNMTEKVWQETKSMRKDNANYWYESKKSAAKVPIQHSETCTYVLTYSEADTSIGKALDPHYFVESSEKSKLTYVYGITDQAILGEIR